MAILTLLIRVFVQWPRKRDRIFVKKCIAQQKGRTGELYQVEIILVQTYFAIEDLLLFTCSIRNEMLIGL